MSTHDVENEEDFVKEEQGNQEGVFNLPIGLTIGGKDILELGIADTGSEAEKIYTKRPKQGKLHTWMGQVISVSVSEIGGVSIASEFIKQVDKNIISEEVKKIPFLDAGSLLVQIQRECWEDTIPEQKIKCTNCGANLTAEIELKKIISPVNVDKKALTEYTIKLKKPHIIKTGIEVLDDYEGYKFNRMVFRTVTLGDAINHEGIAKDEVQFWRNLAFDTLLDLYYEDEKGEILQVPKGFIAKRGKALFQNDLDSKKLKEIRTGMQTTQPSTKTYYEENCPECSEPTPFFASVSHFFQV